jgi:hypothetical protein
MQIRDRLHGERSTACVLSDTRDIRPRRRARATVFVLLFDPNLVLIWWRLNFTMASEMYNLTTASRLEQPLAVSSRTSVSRTERASIGGSCSGDRLISEFAELPS